MLWKGGGPHTHTHIQKEKEEVDEGCKEGMIFLSKY